MNFKGLGILFMFVVLGLLVGVLAALTPMAGVLIVTVCTILVFVVGSRKYLGAIFIKLLGASLVGYVLLGRGFAYLGVPPFYIGEMVMAIGILAAMLQGSYQKSLRTPLIWLTYLYILWGCIRTIPYLGVYGNDALRDGVLWGYALLSLSLLGILREVDIASIIARYNKVIPLILVFGPISGFVVRFAYESIPQYPITGVPILGFKGGDFSVHLVGIAAFLLLGLHNGRDWFFKSDKIAWVLWLVGAALVMTGRSGVVTIAVTLIMLFLLRPSRQWRTFAIVSAVVVVLGLGFNVDIGIGSGRSISLNQVVLNAKSTFSDSGMAELENSKAWRQNWWMKIIGYTFEGDYFWGGKGFGINLADDDGFQVSPDQALRSPHNGHLTILARSGVPGFIIWFLLQSSFGLSLLKAYFRARGAGRHWWARLDLWVLAYWLAFLVDATFDVFLEGPQGGIWFWAIFGFGLAVIQAQKDAGVALNHDLKSDVGSQPIPATGR